MPAPQAGTQFLAEYFEVNGVRFPVEQEVPVELSPLEPFAPVAHVGDPTLVSDDRLATYAWGDQRGGMGVFRYDDPADLTGYQDSDLDTRFQGVLVLPPLKTRLSATLSGVVTTTPVYGAFANTTGSIQRCLWQPGTANAWRWDGTTFTAIALTGSPAVYAFCTFGGLYVLGTSTGVWTSPDGVAWTQRATYNVRGLCSRFNRLYSVDNVGQVRWTTDATLTTWPSSSSDTIHLDPGETPVQCLQWRDRWMNRVLCIVTTHKVWVYDDGDYFYSIRDIWPWKNATWPYAHVWQRDDNLYLSFWPDGDDILQLTLFDEDNVNPNRRGGIPGAQRFAVSQLVGSIHWLYAAATSRAGQSYPGRSIAYNAEGGWSTLDRGSSASHQVAGVCYGAGVLWTIFFDGTVDSQPVPDVFDQPVNLQEGQYEQGPYWHTYGITDFGLRDVPKNVLWVTLNAINPDLTLGIPPGSNIYCNYKADGGNWVALPTGNPNTSSPIGLLTMLSLAASSQRWPLVLPLAPPSGARCYLFQVQVGMSRAATTTTPILIEASAHYLRVPLVRYGVQVRLDLSDENAKDWGPDRKFYGKSQAELIAAIQALGAAQEPVAVKFGYGALTHEIAAADIRVASTLHAATGAGLYTCTLRDVSPPPSGY